MDYQHWKAKSWSWWGYETRKSYNAIKWNIMLPRSDWTWYRQTDSKRSARRKFLEKIANKKIRLSKEVASWWSYKKYFNIKWELD